MIQRIPSKSQPAAAMISPGFWNDPAYCKRGWAWKRSPRQPAAAPLPLYQLSHRAASGWSSTPARAAAARTSPNTTRSWPMRSATLPGQNTESSCSRSAQPISSRSRRRAGRKNWASSSRSGTTRSPRRRSPCRMRWHGAKGRILTTIYTT